jgi:hypothetical protein
MGEAGSRRLRARPGPGGRPRRSGPAAHFVSEAADTLDE